MAIQTGLILRTVFGPTLRQTEWLIGSIIHLLGIELAVPDHSTLGRRAQTVTLPKWTRRHAGPLQLIVDSTGVKQMIDEPSGKYISRFQNQVFQFAKPRRPIINIFRKKFLK